MGSSLSGLLGISYMDRLERQALNICRTYAFFTRYIDDILILTSSREEANKIALTFNNIDKNIHFTIEHPDCTGALSLLDFRLKVLNKGEIH